MSNVVSFATAPGFSIGPHIVIIGILASCCGAATPVFLVGVMMLLAIRHTPKQVVWDSATVHRALEAVDRAREQLLQADSQARQSNTLREPQQLPDAADVDAVPAAASEAAVAAVKQLRDELPSVVTTKDWIPWRTRLVVGGLRIFMWYAVFFALGVAITFLIMHYH